MKIVQYSEIQSTNIENKNASGIKARVVIGKSDGAINFCMRVFELSSKGKTHKHSHDWEHEIFFHRGEGEIYNNCQLVPVKSIFIAFIPSNEEHQIRHCGKDELLFVCLVPENAPEL